VLVRFAPGTADNDRASARQALQAQNVKTFALVNGLEVIQTPLDVPQAIAALSNNPNVLYVEPDYLVYPIEFPDDTHFALQWGLHNTGQDIQGTPGEVDTDIDAPEAWLMAPNAQTVVAIIDSGTQLDHADLAANIWVNEAELNGTPNVDDDVEPNGYVDDINGWDFFSDDADPSDESGHGTHTAGTVGAETNNGTGIAGVCGGCRLMPLRFLGPLGGSTSDAIDAINYAVDNGATVSNNSWGGGAYSQSLYQTIAAAGEAGHIFVAAAGNDSWNNDSTPTFPASYNLDNIISVAATDNRDVLAGFSNFGPASVDLSAPGVNIASSYWDPITPGDDYWWSSGTSMAAPHVAGVVALVQSAQQTEPGAFCVSAETGLKIGVVERVLRSVRTVPELAPYVATGGVVNAADAINCAMNVPWPLPEPPELPPAPTSPPIDLAASDSGNGSYLLTWTGVADASYYLVEWIVRRKNGRRLSGGWFQLDVSPGSGGNEESYEHVIEPNSNTNYRIAAGNPLGNTVMSDWVPVTGGDTTDPDDGGGGGGSGRCHPKRGC
jgi:subtilisin family serine protease